MTKVSDIPNGTSAETRVVSDIIQADRDAAAAFAAHTSGAPITDPDIQACIKGEMDGTTVVQHFARARRNEAARIEERFWSIVDRDGLSGLPSDMFAALDILVRHWNARAAITKATPEDGL